MELSKGSGNKATRKPNGCRGNTQRRDTPKDERERERERSCITNCTGHYMATNYIATNEKAECPLGKNYT